MKEVLMIIFVGVSAISTAVYAFYSMRLWKATRLSADIGRYTLFLSFLLQLHKYAEEARELNKPEATILEQIELMIMELGVDHILKDIDFEKDKAMREYIVRLES